MNPGVAFPPFIQRPLAPFVISIPLFLLQLGRESVLRNARTEIHRGIPLEVRPFPYSHSPHWSFPRPTTPVPRVFWQPPPRVPPPLPTHRFLRFPLPFLHRVEAAVSATFFSLPFIISVFRASSLLFFGMIGGWSYTLLFRFILPLPLSLSPFLGVGNWTTPLFP